MRLVARLVSILLMLFIVVTAAAPAVAAPDTAPTDLVALAKRAAELVNQERVKAGLNPLKWNDQLAASGTAYAEEMAAKGFFSHTGLDGSTPTDRAKRAGYPAYGWGGLYVGENLGRGYDTAESVHQAWMASPAHRQNLLLPKYREIGIGIAADANGNLYWAQEFGSRPNALPIFVNNTDSPATDSSTVTLTLTDEEVSPWGSIGAIAGMMLSNRPDFAGAKWEPFSKIKPWTLLARPGTETVYAMLRDASGHVVQSSASVEYVGRVALALDEPQALAEAVPQGDGQALGMEPSDETP